jgi:hypothetical protein
VDLEAARAALGVSEDDVRVRHVFEGDAAGLLETGACGLEQVDDRAAAPVPRRASSRMAVSSSTENALGDRPSGGSTHGMSSVFPMLTRLCQTARTLRLVASEDRSPPSPADLTAPPEESMVTVQ